MTIEGLGFVNSCLEELGIPYQFMEWSSKVPDTYFVGEYQEIENENEDGCEKSSFILTGTTNQKYLELETVKQAVKDKFKDGFTAILDNGSGIAISYGESYPIPSVDFDVHRLQITLNIKEWKGQ